MPRNDDVTGIVLAGGAGRRMGAPKPLLRLGDKTLVEHVVAAIEPLVSGVTVVTNDAEAMAFLGLPTVGDAEPGRGPLMGLVQRPPRLLRRPSPSSSPVTPHSSRPRSSQALIARRRPDAMTLPATERGPQPMPGLYPTTIASEIASLLEGGRAAMRDLVAAGPVELLSAEDVRALDPEGSSFSDLDTPEDLAAAQAHAGEGERSRYVALAVSRPFPRRRRYQEQHNSHGEDDGAIT